MDPSRSSVGRAMALRRLGSVAVLVALVAGCGAVMAPGGTQSGGKHAVRAAESHRRMGRAREVAQAYARRLLAELRLPAGARRTAWPAGPSRLLKPMLPAPPSDVADVRVLYRVGAPMSSVSQFLVQHLPPGMMPGEGGQAGQNGTTLAQYVNYLPKSLPRGVFYAELATAVVPAKGGGSLLRADAQVTWYPPRSAAEYIHASRYRSVTVTAPPVGCKHCPARTVTRKFTSHTVVARLAALVNGMPVLPPFTGNCPAMDFSGSSIIFTPRTGRWPRIVVSPDDCLGDSVRVGGRAQPVLDEHQNGVIAVMLRLLGIRVR